VGRATGELNTAMGKLRLDMEPPIAPYFELFKVRLLQPSGGWRTLQPGQQLPARSLITKVG